MPAVPTRYTGRFAPSPTGPLHAGSLATALASWLDARAWNNGRGGRWLVRMENLDHLRCVPGCASVILQQLQDCFLLPDEAPLFQSQHIGLYRAALQVLVDTDQAYPCACSRQDIETALAGVGHARSRDGELVYPGTCRHGLHGKTARAWRFRVPALSGDPQAFARRLVHWSDRRLGPFCQHVAAQVGDFVLQRADGPFSYQLAVVVDDGAQGVTHVVRGADLADNTPRQVMLQRALKLRVPRYLHTPLVLGANGEKLSKQNGAAAVDTRNPVAALNAAAGTLGLPGQTGSIGEALSAWVGVWRHLYNPRL